MEILVYREEGNLGPYTLEELQARHADGTVQADDLIWHEGLLQWESAGPFLKRASVTAVPLAEKIAPDSKKGRKGRSSRFSFGSLVAGKNPFALLLKAGVLIGLIVLGIVGLPLGRPHSPSAPAPAPAPDAAPPAPSVSADETPILQQSRDLEAQGNPTEAVALLKREIEAHPQDAPLQVALIELLLRTKQDEDALTQAQAAMQAHPDDPSVLASSAVAMAASGLGPAASDTAHRAIALAPDLSEAWQALGASFVVKKDWSGAIEPLEKAIDLDPSNEEAWKVLYGSYQGNSHLPDGALKMKAILDRRPDAAPGWYILGAIYEDQGEKEHGGEAFEKSVSLNPKLGAAWSYLGIHQSNAGNLDEAIDDFKKCLENSPNDAVFWNNLGYTYMLKQDFVRALPALQHCLSIDPKYNNALFNIARVYIKLDRKYDADQTCETLAAFDPVGAAKLRDEVDTPPSEPSTPSP